MITGTITVVRPAAQVVAPGVVLPAGPAGEDAYQIAIDLGFVGTRAQWLATLVGPLGPSGPQGLTGPQGSIGLQGATGPTGPQPWQTPPTAWAASTSYTAVSPASVVTYNGSCYVCSITHTSGSTFDASKWVQIATAGAASAGALQASNNLSDLTSVGQALVNLKQASTAPSAATSLAATDMDRDLYPTGTLTITVPNGGAGWRSGIITNDNPVTGLITLAVPSGATLEGATNGTTVLFPFQRARIRQIGATAYRTDWVERSPLVASASVASGVASLGLNLPAGYSGFRIVARGILLSTTGANLGYRISSSGFGGIKSGASDYTNVALSASGSASTTGTAALSYGYVAFNQNDNTGSYPTIFIASFFPGASGQVANLTASALLRDNSPAIVAARYDSVYTGATSGAIGRANFIQFVPTTGNINQAFVDIYGEP